MTSDYQIKDNYLDASTLAILYKQQLVAVRCISEGAPLFLPGLALFSGCSFLQPTNPALACLQGSHLQNSLSILGRANSKGCDRFVLGYYMRSRRLLAVVASLPELQK